MPDATPEATQEQPSDATPDAAGTGFTARINLLIRKFGSISRIAQMCGFSEGAVRSWRDGRSDPSRSRCVALASSLGISLMWLMSGTGDMLESIDKKLPPASPTAPAMDTQLLSNAIQVLQSTLKSTGNDLPAQDRAALLGEYYIALSNPDPIARAEGLSEVHRHLVEHIRRTKPSA